MWRQICLVLVILFFGSISTIRRVQAESPENVRGTLKVLQSWLAEDNNSRDWNEFLKTKTLQQELHKGEQADRKVVEEILSLYSSETPGLDRYQFIAVRESLDRWLTTLSLPDVDELPVRIREAKSRFIPSATGSVEQAQSELSQLLSQLEQFLASGGRRKELGWKEYLRWDEIQSELASEDGPDLKNLKQIQKRFFEDFEGLDLPVFVATRQALRKYAESVVYSSDKFQAQFEKAIESLAHGIEVYADQPSHKNAATIAFLLGTFERSGQLPDLVSAVHHHYSKPNYYVQISASLVGLGFEETVDDETPMNENRDGARVTGTVNTTGEIVSRLVPNVHEGEIEIQLSGNARANTRTVSGPATIIASSVTSIDVQKTLFFSDEGIHGTQANANCETDISIQKVLGSATVISRARPKIRAKLPRSELRTARATERRMSRELEKTVAEAVINTNNRYQRQFKAPLMRRDENPGKMNFSTTEDFLLGQMAQANTFQIAAFDRPPKSPMGLDLAVQIHESYMNNFVEAVYGGTELTDEKVAQVAGEIMDTVPERFQRDENAEPWSITFPRRKPLTVIFADGGYTVVIRGRRYTSGDRSLGAWHVAAKYRFEMLPEGPRRIRQGDLDIKPANFTQRSNQKLSITEVAEKNILQRRFSELFTPVIEPEKMELAGQWKKSKKLVMKQLTAEDGWLVMGWQQSKQFQQTITQSVEVNR